MEFIDKIYIINLPEAVDRWNECLEQLTKYNITNYERIDGFRIEFKNVDKQYINSLKKKRKVNHYIKGSYGCKLSHLEILKKYISEPNKNILILEDDFIINENFYNNLEKNINDFKTINNYNKYKLLYLGASFISTFKSEKILNNIHSVNNSYGTFAYIFNTNYANDIYNFCLNTPLEIDTCYTMLSNNINKSCYAIIPSIISHKKENFSFIKNRIRITNNQT
jgi:GR25 family glycosyltransferase involved in LPS biosynthesis